MFLNNDVELENSDDLTKSLLTRSSEEKPTYWSSLTRRLSGVYRSSNEAPSDIMPYESVDETSDLTQYEETSVLFENSGGLTKSFLPHADRAEDKGVASSQPDYLSYFSQVFSGFSSETQEAKDAEQRILSDGTSSKHWQMFVEKLKLLRIRVLKINDQTTLNLQNLPDDSEEDGTKVKEDNMKKRAEVCCRVAREWCILDTGSSDFKTTTKKAHAFKIISMLSNAECFDLLVDIDILCAITTNMPPGFMQKCAQRTLDNINGMYGDRACLNQDAQKSILLCKLGVDIGRFLNSFKRIAGSGTGIAARLSNGLLTAARVLFQEQNAEALEAFRHSCESVLESVKERDLPKLNIGLWGFGIFGRSSLESLEEQIDAFKASLSEHVTAISSLPQRASIVS